MWTRRSRFLAVIVLALLVSPGPACSSGTGPSGLVALTPIGGVADTGSAFASETMLVIRDDAAWSAFWTSATAKQNQPPALPSVDFTKDLVVVGAMGTQKSGGYSIQLTSATGTNNVVTVTVAEQSPGNTCAVSAIVTAPAAIARMRKASSVQFNVTRTVFNCG